MSEIDGEDGLVCQLYILRCMSNQLPDRLAEMFNDQIDKIIDSINNRNQIILDLIKDKLDDARLEILSQQFDLESTKQEKIELEQKLRDIGL